MKPRIDFTRVSPRALQAMMGLQTYVNNSGLEHGLLELMKMRASQIQWMCVLPGHAYQGCTRRRRNRAAAVPARRLARGTLYSARERAALEWTEALTILHEDHVPDAAFAAVREHFSEEEVVDLSLAVVAINGWNRLMIGFRGEARHLPGTSARDTNRKLTNEIDDRSPGRKLRMRRSHTPLTTAS
jgi:alkylhydroperoxidase family enzyme